MSELRPHIDAIPGFTDEELDKAARGGAPAEPQGDPAEHPVDSVPGFTEEELEKGAQHHQS